MASSGKAAAPGRAAAAGASLALSWAAFAFACVALSPQFLGAWLEPSTPADVLRWSPFHLSLERKQWVERTLQLRVPSLCSETRRRLTLEIAVGLLDNGVDGDFVEVSLLGVEVWLVFCVVEVSRVCRGVERLFGD
jgi:hypothetical protein